MFLKNVTLISKSKNSLCRSCTAVLEKRYFSQELENDYSEEQKMKILQIMNNSNSDNLSRYDISKGRLHKFSQWKNNNGLIKNISDVELIEGFSEKTAKKLFDSILEGPVKKIEKVSKIKGQIIHPYLSESVRQSCKSVLTVYVTVNSVCWALIDKRSYELVEWMYYPVDYPEGKKFQITDILDIAWTITQQLPTADMYVMKAEATTLRAAGSDPNNPKVLAVNLQKAQMVAMIVALINSRNNVSISGHHEDELDNKLNQKVYFLRPTLPYRLFGTLVGNEKVSTDQTVELLLQNCNSKHTNNTHVYIPERLKSMFRSQKDLQQDMLGHCLLLALTFMDLCIYKNQESISKLAKREQ